MEPFFSTLQGYVYNSYIELTVTNSSTCYPFSGLLTTSNLLMKASYPERILGNQIFKKKQSLGIRLYNPLLPLLANKA